MTLSEDLEDLYRDTTKGRWYATHTDPHDPVSPPRLKTTARSLLYPDEPAMDFVFDSPNGHHDVRLVVKLINNLPEIIQKLKETENVPES
jgi:hypothetical protein